MENTNKMGQEHNSEKANFFTFEKLLTAGII